MVWAEEMNEIRCSIEVREDESRMSPGRITGTLITYGQRATDRAEVFDPGSLRWAEKGVILNRQHSRAAPILRFTPIVQGNEVRIDAAIPNTSAGRDLREEVRAGLFTGLSIEFRAIRERMSAGVRHISDALLGGAAVVDSPSYATSVEVRQGGSKRRRIWL